MWLVFLFEFVGSVEFIGLVGLVCLFTPANPMNSINYKHWALWIGIGGLLVLGLGWTGYLSTGGLPVTLIINEQSFLLEVRTNTVSKVLDEAGIILLSEDTVEPSLDTLLTKPQTITLHLARPITLQIDDELQQLHSQAQTIEQILSQTKVTISLPDELLLNGDAVSPEAILPLPAIKSVGLSPQEAVAMGRPDPVKITLNRAMPFTLVDGGLSQEFYTTQTTVEAALTEQQVALFPDDEIIPALDRPLVPNMIIEIMRASPIIIKADSRTFEVSSLGQTVGAILIHEGLPLMGQDFTRPPISTAVSDTTIIEVVRVQETLEIFQENIPFETEWIPDDTMLLDQQEIRQTGQPGVAKSRTRIRYENGQEISRAIEDEWLDTEPQNRIIAYGTNIVVNTLQTENGPLEYWRRINMRSTAYSATTSGKSPDHPLYGVTRSGLPAGFGIVATDPRVIPLKTNLYIDGYGSAVAGDTGGRVLGKHIDLGYDDNQPLPDMFGWRDVYILTPIPPVNQIRYVLPQWPQK